MSLDLYLEFPEICPSCGHKLRLSGRESWTSNITHNLVPMWRKAGVYDALYMSDGQPASRYLEVLKSGVQDMLDKPDEYKQLNPPNRWGDYEGALQFLWETTEAFSSNPGATIRVSK